MNIVWCMSSVNEVLTDGRGRLKKNRATIIGAALFQLKYSPLIRATNDGLSINDGSVNFGFIKMNCDWCPHIQVNDTSDWIQWSSTWTQSIKSEATLFKGFVAFFRSISRQISYSSTKWKSQINRRWNSTVHIGNCKHTHQKRIHKSVDIFFLSLRLIFFWITCLCFWVCSHPRTWTVTLIIQDGIKWDTHFALIRNLLYGIGGIVLPFTCPALKLHNAF